MRRLAVIVALLAVGSGALVTMGSSHGDGPYRVRAIFDNAAFVVRGLDVKVAGVRVGSISDLEVTEDNRAAVIMDIEDPAFQDFRRDAHCKVRPASLIGEEYIDCEPTQPRPGGEQPPPPLERLDSGQRLLPVQNTSASVDLDLIAEAMRRPQRERLAIILGELGVGVAGRGRELNEIIRRANPALRETNEVLDILARQNDVLADLAADSDRIMAPLARERREVTGFIEQAGDVAQATAERREALQANLERFPTFLRELRPTMARLEELATEMTPVLGDLRQTAPRLNTLVREMGPFSRAGTTALSTLGDVAEPGIPAIRASLPILRDVRRLARTLRPVAEDLDDVLVSLERNDGLERLMDYVFYQAMAVNGFDSVGHFLRAALIVNVCSTYATTPVSGCESTFTRAGASASAASAQKTPEQRLLAGEEPEDVLTPEQRRAVRVETERLKRELVEEAERKAKAAPPAAPAGEQPPPAARPEVELMDYLFGSDS